MSETSDLGVLYTEHSGLAAGTPLASLWSYETCVRGRNRRSVARTGNGDSEYWLEQSDPLLNTILPGTCITLIVNLGDLWAAGRSLATSAFLPRVSVIGPVTQPRILRVGRSVRAVGACFLPMLSSSFVGVPASELVDRIVSLDELWNRDEFESLSSVVSGFSRTSDVVSGFSRTSESVAALKSALLDSIGHESHDETVGHVAPALIMRHRGCVSIEAMSRSHGLSRQQFATRFTAAAGLPPKLFARITRFQSLVHGLLSTDVSRWASLSAAAGFYDQAHMINEFRAFTGSPPTVFFQPHDGDVDRDRVQLRGRPSEWLVRSMRTETRSHREGQVTAPLR